MILFLANVKYLSLSVVSSLEFCYRALIPSLFPCMVISSVILYTIRIRGDFKIIDFILDNCKMYANEIFLGWLCGFVIGARGICQKYKYYNDENAFNRSVFLTSNVSLAFVVGCVGIVIWQNVIFGIYLYLIQIISSLLIFKIQGKGKECSIASDTIQPQTLTSSLIKAIKSSTDSIITICGFNIFFSSVSDLINRYFSSDKFKIINTLIFDFSRGSFGVVKINDLLFSSFLTGFCIGFGGLCVHMQIFAECEGYPLNKLKFTFLKTIQGSICGIFALIFNFL